MMSLKTRTELLQTLIRSEEELAHLEVDFEAAAQCWEQQVRKAAWPIIAFDASLNTLTKLMGLKFTVHFLALIPFVGKAWKTWLNSMAGMSL